MSSGTVRETERAAMTRALSRMAGTLCSINTWFSVSGLTQANSVKELYPKDCHTMVWHGWVGLVMGWFKISPCCPGSLGTRCSPASVSQVLGLQAYVPTPSSSPAPHSSHLLWYRHWPPGTYGVSQFSGGKRGNYLPFHHWKIPSSLSRPFSFQ